MAETRLPLIRRLQTPLWIIQAAFFLLGGAGWLSSPGLCLEVLLQDPPLEWTRREELAIGAICLLGPFSIGMGLFTIHAQMRAGAWIRQAYAKRYAAFLLIWSSVFVYNFWVSPIGLPAFVDRLLAGDPPGFFDRYAPGGVLFLSGGLFFVLVDALIGFLPDERARMEESRGSADTKPPSLWGLWMTQGIWYLLLGIFLFLVPAVYLGLISVLSLGGGEGGLALRWEAWHGLWWLTYADDRFGIAVDQVRMVSPYYIGMGLMSFVAVRVHRWWIWQQFTWLFGLWQALWVATAVYVWDVHLHSWPYFVFAAPTLLFALLNARYALLWDHSFENESLARPKGWLGMDWLSGGTMALQAIQKNRRSSHLVGIGCDGRFECPATPEYPPLEFFSPGASYDVIARFANLTEVDDAALDVRGAAVRLIDRETGEARFEVLMNTGAFCPAGNLLQFSKFVLSKWMPEGIKRRALQTDRGAFEGGVAGLRRAPDSFADQRYYSQMVRHWIDEHGVTHLCRFRLIPADPDVAETGLPSEHDCETMYRRERLPTETRAANYLRHELHERLRWGEIPLKLQVQLHRPLPGDGVSWYDPSIDWPEDTHPWRDLGSLVIDDPLSAEDTERLRFDPGNLPWGVGVPVSFSPSDPRSMAYSEVRVVAALQALRSWMYRWRGLPESTP